MRKINFNGILNIIANACPSYKFIFQARHIVPIEQKIAQVIPLIKNAEKILFNNYRPVSVLPFFQKYQNESITIFE